MQTERIGDSGRRRAPLAEHAPLLLGIGLGAFLVAVTLAQSLHRTDGRLVYPLDDAYIHLAMARNVAEHGVWGVTRHEFSATSSSPLWTLLLSGCFLAGGPREIVPLALNLAALFALLAIAGRILRALAPFGGRAAVFSLLAAILLFTPLVPLAMTGQEHLLHLTASLAFVYLAARRLTGTDASAGRRERAAFWLLAPVLVLLRYESLFLLAPVAAGLLLRGRRTQAAALGALALAPLVAVGIVHLAHGAFFLPNPILRKANLPWNDAGQLIRTLTGYTAVRRLFVNAHLLFPALAALLLLARPSSPGTLADRTGRAMLILFLIALFLHLSFADVGWFYRYEAYLMGIGLLALGLVVLERAREWRGAGLPARPGKSAAAIAAAALFLVAVGDRGVRAFLETPRAAANIYEQQIQMGLFLRDHYAGEAVALNDIGAANYLADITCVDLYGLANRDVLRAIREKTYDVNALARVVAEKRARIAVVYPHWLRIPPSWTRVGEWQIRDNVVNGGDRIAFYAIEPGEREVLAAKLRRFAARLPARVRQGGLYVERP